MKKYIIFLLLFSLVIFMACELADPAKPTLTTITKDELVLNKMVSIGNSITMGIQSAGIVQDFQMNNYPYIISKQIKAAGYHIDFQQPLIAAPGLGEGGRGPMKLENGNIVLGDPSPANPLTIALNVLLSRPYDNLGISGADLNDVLNTTSGGLFDLVLRNPNFGNTTQLEQAIALKPTLILLWVGNNDVLGAAINGSDSAQYITSQAVFQSRMTTLLTRLRDTTKVKAAIVMANIPSVTDIPYVNTLDIIFRPILRLGITVPVPVMVDATFQPIVFDTTGGPLYLPLLTEEPMTTVEHLLLPALSAYQQGIGVPDSAALVNMGLPAPLASQLVAGMMAQGITPTGVPFPASMTMTTTESANIKAAVDGYNAIIDGVVGPFQILKVDANALLNEVNLQGKDGVSGRFALLAPGNTGFSLDGVHPNNAGHAIIANAFIDMINLMPGIDLPRVNVADYLGQYISTSANTKISLEAINQVKEIYRKDAK